MPHVARTSSSSVIASTTSSAPRLSTCDACGTMTARSATRIALETSASPRTSANARSARIAALLRGAAQRGAVSGVDVVELGSERRERGVAELRHKTAREIAAQARAVLRARERRTVYVGLAGP